MKLKTRLLGAALGWICWAALTPWPAGAVNPVCEPEDWNCGGTGNGIVLINTDGFTINPNGYPTPVTPYIHESFDESIGGGQCADYADDTELWLGDGYRESVKALWDCWKSSLETPGLCEECLYEASESDQCQVSAARTWEEAGLSCELVQGGGGPMGSTYDVLCRIRYHMENAVNPMLRFMVADPMANPPEYRELMLTGAQIDDYQPRVPGEDTLIVLLDDLPAGICPNFLKHYNIELSFKDEVCGLDGPHDPLYTGDIENYQLWLNRSGQDPVLRLTLWGSAPDEPCVP